MASDRPRQRLQQIDDEGFTLVDRRRRKAPVQEIPPDHRRYKLVALGEEETAYRALCRLEAAEPNLRVRITVQGDDTYITPRDEETAFRLSRYAREGGTYGFALEEAQKVTRGVVMRYPLRHPLEPLQQHPRVTFVRRCVKRVGHGRTELTRQVEVTFRGVAPTSLDLGFWGVFSVRKYFPEPLRCFKCQAFGHVQKYCTRTELCGVCSQQHRTSVCLDALRGGETRKACCPNCGGGHHVWSRLCPERARRLPPRPRAAACQAERGDEPTTQTSSHPANPPPPGVPASVPVTPGKKRRRRRRTARSLPAPEQPVTSPAPPIDIVNLTEAACQTEPDTKEASSQTTKCVVMTQKFFEFYVEEMCRIAWNLCSDETLKDDEIETFKGWPEEISRERTRLGNFEPPTLEDCLARRTVRQQETVTDSHTEAPYREAVVNGITIKIPNSILPRPFVAGDSTISM